MSMKNYRAEVVNENGYVLEFPCLNEEDDPKATYPINPFAESLNGIFPLETVARQGKRAWQYCKNGAVALNIAAPFQSAAAIHAEADDDIVVGAASAIGALTVTLTSTANLATTPLSVKDGFKDGYLIVNDLPGEGQLRRIKGHEAASGTANFVVTLYEPLTIALTTASQVGLIQNPCANVIASTAVAAGKFMGVPLIPITANYYFWGQFEGIAPGIPDGAIAKGSPVVIGVTAAKFSKATVAAGGAGGETIVQIVVGEAVTPAIADTESFMVFLNAK